MAEYAIDQGGVERAEFFVPMFEGVNSISWTIGDTASTLATGYAGNHTLFEIEPAGDGSSEGMFIVGEQGDWRYGAMSQSLFDNSNNAGSMQLLNNAIDWLLKDDSPTKSINVLSVQVPDGYYSSHNNALRSWLNTHYNGRHSINAANSCDYGAMAGCLDTYQPDLIVFGGSDSDDLGYQSLENAVDSAVEQNIPFIITHYRYTPSVMTDALRTKMKISAESNTWRGHRIGNLMVTEQFKTENVNLNPLRIYECFTK